MSPTTPSTTTPSTAAANALSSAGPLASEGTFLQLLVSQLQNQDPLNPMDSTQFVSQLTSYSQLEQLINIDSNTAGLASASTTPATGTTPTTGAGS